MATLKQRIDAFLNVGKAETSSPADAVALDGGSDVWEALKADRDRMAIVKTCREMYRQDSRVEKAHRFYARDIVRGGFVVQTSDPEAKRIADELQKRLDLNQVLEDAVRLDARDGDGFHEVVVNQDMEIIQLSRKPTLQVRRASNSKDEFDDARKAFWMSGSPWYGGEPPADAVWFAAWQMIHARWKYDGESRYGTPMFASATAAYKRVQDGELNVAVRRKIGGAQIRQHVVEGSAADLKKYKEDNEKALGKLAAVIDFFSNKQSSLTVHQGDGNIDRIGDVQHHVATMMTASDVPMELIAYGGELNRDILGEKKEEYEETLRQGREWVTAQILRPLLERQWMLMGILPAAVDYRIIWRTAKSLTPADLRDLADAGARLKLLGVKDEIIQQMMATYIQNVDTDLLDMDGFSAAQFAQNVKGVSV